MGGFKKFILRGNVVDLAVGVVIGAAFGLIVTSFVNGIINPLIGLFGTKNFDQYRWCLTGTCSTDGKGLPTGHVLLYGSVVSAVTSFVLVAAAVYFLVVVPVGRLLDRTQKAPDPTHKDCPECLSSIPIAATRCAFCTVEQVEA